MSSLQLEENVQNVISTLIRKYPLIEPDLLYLRTVFIESAVSMKQKLQKITKKYQKTKQKLNTFLVEKEIPNQVTDPNLNNKQEGCKRIKSPQKYQNNKKNGIKQDYKQIPNDNSENPMAFLLIQAKSIKTIFDSLMKSQLATLQHIPLTKVLNLYTVFKNFYKSFKQTHKEYIQNFSYDEKHIHKNSTAMKNRLLEELKAQTQRRKELEQQLEDLEEMMEKSVKHKDKQLQKLNQRLIQLIKENKVYQDRMAMKGQQQLGQLGQKKSQVTKKESLQDQVLGKFSRIKKPEKKCFDHIIENRNHLRTQSSKQFDSPSDDSHSENSNSQDSDLQDAQQFTTSHERFKVNRSNLGKFYNGNDTIITGKLNETQSVNNQDKKNTFISVEQKPQQNRNYSKDKLAKKSKTINNPRITFGSPGSEPVPQIIPTVSQFVSSNNPKQLEKQIRQLKEQLLSEKQQKNLLEVKIKESDLQYKKLESEVNELYKMINHPQFTPHVTSQKSQQAHQQAEETPTHIFKINQQNHAVNTSPIRNQDPTTKRRQTTKDKAQLKNDDFDDCQDYEDIINKAEQNFLNKSILSSENKKKDKNVNFNLNVHNEIVSPSKTSTNSKDTNVKKLVSPPKNFSSSLSKTNTIKIDSMHQNKDTRNLQYQNTLSQVIPSSIPANSNKQIQQQTKVQIQKIGQFYEGKCAQKDEEIQILKDQAHQSETENNGLIMMLLLQSISVEEFIQKNNNTQGDDNERFGYRNQYGNEFGRIS